MTGSVNNVEVYRCVRCDGQVALSPEGFAIDEQTLNESLEAHLKVCPNREGTTDAEDQAR